MTRAVIYCRISQDRVGAGLGVARQRLDCEALARQRGWNVVAVYEDNDLSAYSGRPRPGYQRLLGDIQQGLVDVVLAWHTDRLHRSPVELEAYISACGQHDVATVTVRAGELDLATASGRMVARMLGAAARHESEQKSERIRRTREQEAQAGRIQGILGYGWRPSADPPSGWEVDPHQASVVRDIADQLLAGHSLGGIARRLNDSGEPTPTGLVGAWRGANIRGLITAGRYCGWREHTPPPGRGERSRGRGTGELVAQGSWPPILERSTTERLRLLLSDPARQTGGRPGRATYLLSAGLARCGRCASPLAGHRDLKRNVRRYLCVNQPGLKRCGRLTIAADSLDALVTAAILGALTNPPPLPTADAGDAEAQAEIGILRQRLDDLATLYAEGAVSQAEWLTARKKITARLDAAQIAVRTQTHQLVLSDIPSNPADVEHYWASLALGQQRAIASALLESVVVAPATRGGNRIDPTRVSLHWRS